MDPTDRDLLALLQTNARLTNRALADEVSLAPSSTLARVRALEQSGVITGYHADTDLKSVGRGLQAMVFVRLSPKTETVVDDFFDHVWAMPETIGVFLLTGIQDVLVHLALGGTDDLREIVLAKISSFPGVVDERTSIVFEHRRKTQIDPVG